MKTHTKSPWLTVAPIIIVLSVVVWEVLPWVLGRPPMNIAFVALFILSAIIWVLVLWWALHQLLFQLAALCPLKLGSLPAEPAKPLRLLIFYVTRDDFIPDCCQSCLDQDYPTEAFKVVICDDSQSDSSQAEIARFCTAHKEVLHLRRSSLHGFKAGNLNHAFEVCAEGKCDWVVVVDADQMLPKSFVRDLSRVAAQVAPEIAFVQAGRDPLHGEPHGFPSFGTKDRKTSPFQRALCEETRIFYERDMYWRERSGFLPFLGHGGAVRHEAWKAVGGFPEVVSEDYAFSMAARIHGFRGERIEQVRSWDGYPKDFGAFLVRLCKFSSGAAELLRRSLPQFLRSDANWIEKLDATMLLATYLLMPLITLNWISSAYLCHVAQNNGVPILAPRLPYLFIAMFLAAFPILFSISQNPGRALRHWFWAFGVYSAAMPFAAWNMLVSFFMKAQFRRTPKGTQPSPSYPFGSALSCGLGILGLALAWTWRSPFSLILGASSAASALFPFYRWLHEESTWRGRLSRLLVYVPGLLFIAGLLEMWIWATS